MCHSILPFQVRSGFEAAAEKLRSRMDIGANGCLNYTGPKDKDGYGLVSMGARKSYRAHRLAFLTFVSDIPIGMVVKHSCDNPTCFNPSHLSIGTVAENNQERVIRNRSNTGTINGMSKITEVEVAIIRRSKASSAHIADLLGISPSQVSRIRKMEQWKHVGEMELPEWAERLAKDNPQQRSNSCIGRSVIEECWNYRR